MVITSHFLPYPSANGINSRYIINELKKRGYKVTCISVKRSNEKDYEIIDDTPIYRVTPSFYSQLLYNASKINNILLRKGLMFLIRFLRIIKMMVFLLNFPDFDKNQSRKVYNLLEEIHKKEKFDCIISITKPYANIAALSNFKKKNRDVFCIGYYLDLINSAKKPLMMPKTLYRELCYKGDMKPFKSLDLILLPQGSFNTYNNRRFSAVKDKLEYVDFPTFLSNKFHLVQPNKFITNSDTIVITYAGTLNKDYRNPELLLKALALVSKNLCSIELNIYGGGNCGNIIKHYSSSNNLKVINHGYQPHQKIIKKMINSDFLVNISNTIQDAVPSKIFELFSTGKPILNVIFDKKDITKGYFEKYPSVNNIVGWERIEDQIGSLESFLESEKGRKYNIDRIEKKFIENTPEYTVDIIEKHICKGLFED